MGDTLSQKELFETIHDRYYDATTDRFAEAYKNRFIYPWIERQVGDAGSLIELASGVGAGAGWLKARRPKLEVAGCDISESAARDFTAAHDAPCFVWDLTKPIVPERQYDVALVMGGIHHLVADLPTAFDNIAKLLKPGGRLIMGEPNADYFLEPARRLWYRLDKSYFDSANEHALSHDALFARHGAAFDRVDVTYFGGPAYYLLMLNYVLRLPNGAKRWLAPGAMAIERLYGKLPGRLPFASFMACWQRCA